MPRVDRIEKQIGDYEGFEIRFLHPDGQDVRGDLNLRVPPYSYSRRATTGMTVTDWIRIRFGSRYPGYGVKVLLGDGSVAHGRTILGTVRKSYTYRSARLAENG